jgi:hypothetical protein
MILLLRQAMDPRTESRILRLAIARGLLRWDDLDAVAGPTGAGGPGSWIDSLLAEGRIDRATVDALTAEAMRESGAETPDLGGRRWPWDRGPATPSDGGRQGRRQENEPTRELPAGRLRVPPLPSAAAALPDLPPELSFLANWDRYRVERLLGTGGMGTVYQAFDPALGRTVALKFLHRNDAQQAERFLREARSQARINHPNICPVHEVGEVEGRPYIAMRYVDGRSLAEVWTDLSVESRIRLMQDVALAVHAAHKSGLIHRDLKPGNVLVEAADSLSNGASGESGEHTGLHPFVVDFGLAQDQDEPGLTRSGMITGTPAYLSPEQAQGDPLDRRSDVYSLGVMLYELLSGHPPFQAPTPAALLVRLLQEEAPPLRKRTPSVPRDLETIVMKCLEKDPGRRYDSARALAEDLGRYLDGEPIQARPDGWAYRAGKKLRKHRGLAAAAAAAVAVLLILGALSLRAQWQAREQAKLAQEFGQRVGELESDLRLEAFQPFHDTTPRKERIRNEMEEIRAEMRRLGPLAEGPGSYALGRAYLALHQYEEAADQLERAWKAGQHGPEVAAALGRSFGFLYESALLGADRSQESARRAARAEIERIFGRPALSYLRQAVKEEDSNSLYLAALIAFYEGRYPDSIDKARQAAGNRVGFYEATQLEAEAYAAQADQASDAGRFDEAFRLYDRSGEVYRDLLARVPSDASLYAGECSRRARKIDAESMGGSYIETSVEEALGFCDRALQVDPELTEALTQKARLYRRRGVQKVRAGEDPGADLASAVAAAERAMALNPRNSLAYNTFAVVLRLQSALEEGGSAPTLERAATAARRAVELQPDRASYRSDLCTIYISLAEKIAKADPRQALEKAIASCDEAVRLDPGYLPAHTNLGSAWKAMAEYQITRGIDPSQAVERAVASSERAVAINPRRAPFHNNVGNAYLTLAEYQMNRGTDPRPTLEKAAQAYRKSIAVDPRYQLGAFNLAWAERSLALALLERGEDPGPALTRAGAALEAALKLNPEDADSFLERSRTALIAGRWEARQGRDPGAAFQAAEADLQHAEQLNPASPEVHLAQALVDRHRAAWSLAGGHRPDRARREIQSGLGHVTEALATNPGEPLVLAEQGMLQSLAARSETDPTRRRDQARRAVASLTRAIELNPLLRREYGAALAEAAGLAG